MKNLKGLLILAAALALLLSCGPKYGTREDEEKGEKDKQEGIFVSQTAEIKDFYIYAGTHELYKSILFLSAKPYFRTSGSFESEIIDAQITENKVRGKDYNWIVTVTSKKPGWENMVVHYKVPDDVNGEYFENILRRVQNNAENWTEENFEKYINYVKESYADMDDRYFYRAAYFRIQVTETGKLNIERFDYINTEFVFSTFYGWGNQNRDKYGSGELSWIKEGKYPRKDSGEMVSSQSIRFVLNTEGKNEYVERINERGDKARYPVTCVLLPGFYNDLEVWMGEKYSKVYDWVNPDSSFDYRNYFLMRDDFHYAGDLGIRIENPREYNLPVLQEGRYHFRLRRLGDMRGVFYLYENGMGSAWPELSGDLFFAGYGSVPM